MITNIVDPFFADNGRLRPIWRFLLGALVFFAAEEVSSAVGAVFSRTHVLAAELVVQAVSVTILLGGFVFLLVAVDHVEDDALPAMGLGWHRRTLPQMAAGAGIGIVMALACATVLMASSEDVSVRGHIGSYALIRTALALAVLSLGAMSEEAAFRGYPFQRLTDAAGPVVAITVVQVGFGLIHGKNPGVSPWALANTALFGVLLALAYLRSRSLWLPWGIHFGWNAMLAIGLGLPLSGLTIFATLWHTHVRGPRWMTGGPYGIEAGGLTTAAILLAVPLVWWAGAKIGESGTRGGGQSEDPEAGRSEHAPAN